MSHIFIHHSRARYSRPAVLTLLMAVAIVVALSGCADPRTQPFQPGAPSHTETIVLWEDAVTNGDTIAASFNVAGLLASIANPAQDSPARLTLVAYIRPDCQVARYDSIVMDAIPSIFTNRMVPLLVAVDSVRKPLDAFHKALLDTVESIQLAYADSAHAYVDSSQIDTTYNGQICDTALYKYVLDSISTFPDSIWAIRDAYLDSLPSIFRTYENTILSAQLDTAVLGIERDDLGVIVDNRYVLALWMDTTVVGVLPEAVYASADRRVADQNLYLAATDTVTGYKGRGFNLRLNSFFGANPDPDPFYLGKMREFNWTTCGSPHPCMSPGDHTLRVRVSGPDTKVTGTLVLVYEGTNP